MKRGRGLRKRTGLINTSAPGRSPKTRIGSGSQRRGQRLAAARRTVKTRTERVKRAARRLRRSLAQLRALHPHPDAQVSQVAKGPATLSHQVRCSPLSVWAAAPPLPPPPSVRKVAARQNLAKTSEGARSMRRTGAIGRPPRATSRALKGRVSPGEAERTVLPLRNSRTATPPSAGLRVPVRTRSLPDGADRGPRALIGGGGLQAPRRMVVRM